MKRALIACTVLLGLAACSAPDTGSYGPDTGGPVPARPG